MSLGIVQNYSAVVPGANFAQFVATGGVSPFTYAVLAGGAGGSIDSSGNYTAPPTMTAYPATGLYDTIQITDSTSAFATSQILIGTPILLLCDILQTQLGLDMAHCYLWDQKIFQPIDSGLYAVTAVQSCKPFGNSTAPLAADGSQVQQWISMYARIDINILSRGPAARDQKELIPLALNSIYSQQQQEANGFYIGKLPISNGFINLSQVDGAAIPYRFVISYAMQYQVNLTQSVPYFDTFQTVEVITNS